MPKVLRHTLLSVRDLLVAGGPFLLITIALLVAAYVVLDPTPPKRVVLATGAEQGAYAEFGKRYADLLKAHGIKVELRSTQGASENLALLRDENSGVQLGFAQGGSDRQQQSDETKDDETLMSLGSMFYEPVWLFYREDSARRLLGAANAAQRGAKSTPARGTAGQRGPAPTLTSLSQLPGWRVNIGAAGSGVPVLMQRLFEANKLDPASITLVRKTQTPAVVDLLGGETDALVFASAPESLMVQMLLQTPGIRLFDFAQADAYARRFPFLSPVALPRGVVDLAGDLPPNDIRLVAPTATLAARRDVHPALVQLFVQAANTIHGEAGWFQRKGDFPNPRNSEWPLSAEAQRFYRDGPPFLQRYLPFWLANLIDRMWVVLVSIVAILIPLSRVVPPLYEFRVRSRVFRWYGQLRALEEAQGERPADALVRDLAELESRVERITVPLSYADELYALRGHINSVRRRLEGEAAVPNATAGAAT